LLTITRTPTRRSGKDGFQSGADIAGHLRVSPSSPEKPFKASERQRASKLGRVSGAWRLEPTPPTLSRLRRCVELTSSRKREL
jgi:hypothetical protein